MKKSELIKKIYSDLESDIVNEVYPINSKLPSERELSEKYDATRIVIREAIAMLPQSGLVETHPQKGTYIKDFYNDLSLDSLMNIYKISKKIEISTITAGLRFIANNDITASASGTVKDVSENLRKIESAILRKKLYDDPQTLAECDYEIVYETSKVCLEPLAIALTASLKSLGIITVKLCYCICDSKDKINEYDIKIFKALNTNCFDKAVKITMKKISCFEKEISKIEKIKSGKIYLLPVDGKKGKIIDL